MLNQIRMYSNSTVARQSPNRALMYVFNQVSESRAELKFRLIFILFTTAVTMTRQSSSKVLLFVFRFNQTPRMVLVLIVVFTIIISCLLIRCSGFALILTLTKVSKPAPPKWHCSATCQGITFGHI